MTDVTSRLQLLTLHFPKLRIVWSPGPYATGEIFAELKGRQPFFFLASSFFYDLSLYLQKGREQPDPVKAASISSDVYTEKNAEKYNPGIHVRLFFPYYIIFKKTNDTFLLNRILSANFREYAQKIFDGS